jgi:hypothetical protein
LAGGRLARETPLERPSFLVAEVVAGTLLGVAQQAVGGDQAVEALAVPGFLVVGVVALREVPEDAVDRVRVGVGADLEGRQPRLGGESGRLSRGPVKTGASADP